MVRYGMNKTSAKDWIIKAWHHFSSGQLLYEANHYTDVIAVDFHYAIEVLLKSFLATDTYLNISYKRLISTKRQKNAI